jgi:Xaa-Pro aminopeptidase
LGDNSPYHYPGYPAGLKSPWVFPLPSEKERDKRWNAIRKMMQKCHFDCLIVGGTGAYMNLPNNHLYYFSNFVPFFNPGMYIVFPLTGLPQLGVSAHIGPQFIHCASETSWIREIVEDQRPVESIIRKIRNLKLEKGRLGIAGYKNGIFPASTYDAIRQAFPSASFEDATSPLVETMNEVSRSSEEELAFLRKDCEIHDLSFEAVAKALKPGVSEKDLWAVAEEVIISNGGWFPHFMLVTAGPRPTFTRAPASHYRLQMGDIIIFETNVIYGGVLAQICYALSLGKPEKQVSEMFDFCGELYGLALAELEKNRTFGDIEDDLVKRIHHAGFEPMTPQIHVYNMGTDIPADSPPQPGDYFTVHPNFCTRDFTSGAKFGDAVRIDAGGKVERLQKTPAKLNIVMP